MYIPREFQEHDLGFAEDFLRTYPFAELISVNETGRIIASHLPLLAEKVLDKLIISGHMSAANEQSRHLTEREVLVIFREPHAYISPSHYDSRESVPTWNYAAVHCYCRASIITQKEEKLAQMRTLVSHFETAYVPAFDNLREEYLEKMLNGIVAFNLEITQIEMKKKLSQNKTDEERARISATLADGNELDKAISKMMKG